MHDSFRHYSMGKPTKNQGTQRAKIKKMSLKHSVAFLLGVVGMTMFEIDGLHLHSVTTVVPRKKEVPESSCRAIAPIEILVEDSLQYDLAEPRTVVWQPMWSR